MRKLMIVFFAVHTLLFCGIAKAQAPRSNIELKAMKAQAGDEGSVRELGIWRFRAVRLGKPGCCSQPSWGANHESRAVLSQRSKAHASLQSEALRPSGIV